MSSNLSKKKKSRKPLVPVNSGLKNYAVVRPSAYIQLGDPQLLDRFTVLWEEHIDGFKKRRIRNKKPMEEKMEWQRRLEEKHKSSNKAAETPSINNSEMEERLKPMKVQLGRNRKPHKPLAPGKRIALKLKVSHGRAQAIVGPQK